MMTLETSKRKNDEKPKGRSSSPSAWQAFFLILGAALLMGVFIVAVIEGPARF